MMPRQLRPSFWFEVIATLIGSVLTVLTLVAPTWIETLLLQSPDNGSGETEWFLALLPLALAAASASLAVREWRRAPAR
jgi:hypothetical protein